MNQAATIELTGLSRRYEGRGPVLQGLDLSVQAGEVVAVLGRSGTGKSTLLRVIGGLDSGFEGDVSVCGRSLRGMNDADLSRHRADSVGIIFQSFHLLDHLSARANIDLASGFSDKESPEDGDALLAAVGLAGRGDEAPSQMSGGERQRLAIARALRNRPEVLLADEPTGNLDAETGRIVIQLLADLSRERGVASVWVTHEERLAEAADRVLYLENGRLETR